MYLGHILHCYLVLQDSCNTRTGFENRALLGQYAASSDNFLPTFLCNTVPSPGLKIKDGTDRLSRNVGNKLPQFAALIPQENAVPPSTSQWKPEITRGTGLVSSPFLFLCIPPLHPPSSFKIQELGLYRGYIKIQLYPNCTTALQAGWWSEPRDDSFTFAKVIQ